MMIGMLPMECLSYHVLSQSLSDKNVLLQK